MTRLVLIATALATLLTGVARPQYPVLDVVADKVIQK
jgi:hypothetical protein